MTDPTPGPGWWLASDGNWYPPHLHPDVRESESTTDLGQEGRAEIPSGSPPWQPGLGQTTIDPELASAEHADALFDTPAVDEPAVELPRYVIDHDGTPPAPDGSGTTDAIADASGSIDWEAVAAERAARRAAAQKSPNGRRTALAAVAALVALGAIAAFARNTNDGDGGRTSATTTTAAPIVVTTTAAPESSGPTGDTGPAETVATGPVGATSVFDLAPGACIDQADLTEGLVLTVVEVACDQPHTHEVYLTTSVVPADVAYDAATVTAFANQECTKGFDDYVGIAYNDSRYYFLHLAPSAESWNKDNDRDVVCLLLLDGEKLTGSVKGTAQ